jgi:type III pantothenate kinase
MYLALDVGNSQIFGGLLDGDTILMRFRKASKTGASSDETGIFLRTVLRENGFDPKDVTAIGICSVVPDTVHSLRNACVKYFNLTPVLITGESKTGLRITYPNPAEIGADRIVNAMAARVLYPDRNRIIIDMGTATTFCCVSQAGDYVGGAIMAGMRLNIEALMSKTAKLPSVEIIAPERVLGKNTVESIQTGLYYSHLGAIKEIVARLSEACFNGQPAFVIGTGGFSSLFDHEAIFDEIAPDLVLHGLRIGLELNG